MTGVIYTITNIVTGKIYLGSTKNFDNRKREHLKKLKSGNHHSQKLQNSYNKYGVDSFKFNVLYKSSDIKRDERLELDKLDLKDTYNILATSTGGDTITYHPNREEILKKMSLSRVGQKPANRIKVIVDGIKYDSINEASRQLSIPVVTIRYRCLSLNSKFASWNIVGKEKNPSLMYREGDKCGISINCDGQIFPSYSEAARALGITDTSVKWRVKSNNYPGYYVE